MYNIPIYKQKLYTLIKEEFNLKSNSQAGQYLKVIFKNIEVFSIWQRDGVDRIIDQFRTGFFDGFYQFCGYKVKMPYNHLFPLSKTLKRTFKNKYVKLLFCFYYASDFSFKTYYY